MSEPTAFVGAPVPTKAYTGSGSADTTTIPTGVPIVGKRADGTYGIIALDNSNNLSTVGGSGGGAATGLAVSGTGTLVNDTPIASTDVGSYRSVAIEITTPANLSIQPEVSNDNTNWVKLYGLIEIDNQYPYQSPVNINGQPAGMLYAAPLVGRYFRIRVTSATSGTVGLTAWFSPNPTQIAETSFAGGAQAVSIISTNFAGDAANSYVPLRYDGSATGALAVAPALFNGSTVDRQRGNVESTVLASQTVTTSVPINSADQINFNGRGVQVFVNISAFAGTSTSFAVKLQAKDPASANYVDISGATTAALSATGETVLTVYPGITTAANSAVSAPMPRTWRAVATLTLGVGSSVTFSVAAATLV